MRFFGLSLALFALCTPLSALADAPAFLPVQGYLAAADGTPTEGETTLLLSLYDDAAVGTAFFTETQLVLVEGGHFTVYLGQVEVLDLALFRDNGDVWLGVAVEGEAELSPRLPVGTTAFAAFAQYAASAADADRVGGLLPGDFRQAGDSVEWTDVANVPAGLDDGDGDSLAALICADGQVAKWDATASAWGCAADVDTDTDVILTEAQVEGFVTNGALDLAAGTTLAGASLSTGPHTVNTDTDTLAALGCIGGQVAKWDATAGAWICAPDLNTGTDTLAALGCADGQVAKWNTVAGLWECAGDTDGLGGLSCLGGDVAKWNGLLVQWQCQPDDDTDSVLTEVQVEGYITNAALDLFVGTTLSGAAISTGAHTVDTDTDTNLTEAQVEGYITNAALDLFAGTTLSGANISTGSHTVNTNLSEGQVEGYITNAALDLFAGSTLSGAAISTGAHTVDTDTDTLATLGCADRQVAKWNSVAGLWACAPDVDRLGGLSCLDGDVAKWNGLFTLWECQPDDDADTVLTEAQVEGYITNAALDLFAGTTLSGANISTGSHTVNTNLSEGQVEGYITNAALDLFAGTTLSGAAISTGAHTVDTDTDTNLSEGQVEGYITNAALDLFAGTTLSGAAISTGAHTVDTDTTYSPGTGLSLGGTTFSVNLAWGDARYVNEGQGGSVTSSMLVDGAGSGVDADLLDGQQGGYYRDWGNLTNVPAGFADGTDADTLASTSCAANQVLKWNFGLSIWECANDLDTDTTYSSGSGIDITGTSVSLDTAVTDGLYWSMGGNAGTTPGTDFVGTSDLKELEIHAGGARVMRYEYGTSPNLIGGAPSNSVTAGVWAATVAGGTSGNIVTDSWGTVSGGSANQAGNAGGTASDAGSATVSGGAYNVAAGSNSVIGGGRYNSTSAMFATVAGGGGLSAGTGNEVSDTFGTISGGYDNQAGDGAGTTTDAANATVGGGRLNVASATNATVGGGSENTASGQNGTIGGGEGNIVSGNFTVVAGGRDNQATSAFSVVGGGTYCTATAMGATVAGGGYNTASGEWSVVGGGGGSLVTSANLATDNYCSVTGGSENQAGDNAGTVLDRRWASVGGGYQNTASGAESTIAGGRTNEATATGSFVGGGRLNNAFSSYSAVAGGYANSASGLHSAVLGGQGNAASGEKSAVLGGSLNAASGMNAVAMGTSAQADFDGCFVFGDKSGASTSCDAANRFVTRAIGGHILYSSTGAGAGVVLMPGSSSWLAVSDRNLKDNIVELDGQEVLEKLAEIPMSTWNYDTQDPSIRHMGPMAQDFHAAFGLGPDNRHIATIDADGVALAAIQGLHEQVKEQEARHAAEQEAMEARIAKLEQLLLEGRR